jgi:tripeptidyl-peptidase I
MDLFAPHEDAVEAVKTWLTSEGIHHERITISTNKQWIQFNGTTVEVESLLKTTYHIYEHVDSGDKFLGTDEYHVPHELVDHIDYVTPGVKMAEIRQHERRKSKRDTSQSSIVFGANPIMQPVPSAVANANLRQGEFPCADVITPACLRCKIPPCLPMSLHC